ncbi:hypothetical protein Tco_0065535 [Tanacetum coccineum]
MFSTHDEEEREEESFDHRVQTPSHAESTDDESNKESDEEVQGANTEDEEMNEEATHEEDEAYEAITVRTDTCIDSIFTLNTEATSLVDVSVTTIVEPPLVSATTLPPPPTPLIILYNKHRYLANKMHEAVKTVVQLQSERLRDEAQAENADFLNKLDDNIKKIIMKQVEAYEVRKLILDTYGDNFSFKDEEMNGDKDERTLRQDQTGEEPMHTAKDLEELAHQEFETGATEDQPVDETPQPLIDFYKPLNFHLAIVIGTKTPDHGPSSTLGRKRQQFYGFATNKESAHDVYYKCRIIAIIKLQIVEWHGYKHLDWITVCRHDDKLYTFKEGYIKRLRLQDIEDMLILLVFKASRQISC